MIEVGIYEAKTRLAELLKRVEKGELITITNRGVPVADLVPSAVLSTQKTVEAIAAIKAMAMAKSHEMSHEQFNEMRKRGRR